tara:strand:- start:516 stop:806 length:291 start_codon:yes stop_codon:yes gene_type:complete
MQISTQERFKAEPSRPLVVCEMQAHPKGHFKINGQSYRPTWPVAPWGEGYMTIAEEMVDLGVESANKLYDRTDKHPHRVRVERYEDGKMIRAIVQD